MMEAVLGKYALWFCLILCCGPFNAQGLELMLPNVYSDTVPVSGWLVSEKLDGVRGYWDGERLLSKNGIALHAPREFLEDLPPFALEGEIWGGRNTFAQTMSIVKRLHPHAGWLELQFAIFDVPQARGPFIQRLEKAREWFAVHPSSFAFVIPQKTILNNDQLQIELHRVETLGGEGLIVRNGGGLYRSGRSWEVLKVKSFFDMEAVVVAHVEGRGRNSGRLGSLVVELPDKTRFKIGTGFSDVERDNPPPVGCTITFKYYGFFKSGVPRFPSFLRVRDWRGSRIKVQGER
jgi:DNA ligase-1